jgi:hypothetical protein
MWVYGEEILCEILERYEFSLKCDSEFTVDSYEGKGKGKAVSIQA